MAIATVKGKQRQAHAMDQQELAKFMSSVDTLTKSVKSVSTPNFNASSSSTSQEPSEAAPPSGAAKEFDMDQLKAMIQGLPASSKDIIESRDETQRSYGYFHASHFLQQNGGLICASLQKI